MIGRNIPNYFILSSGSIDQFATSISLPVPISLKLNLDLTKLFLDVDHCLFTVITCCHSFPLQLDSRSFGSASDYDHDSMIKKLSRQREENSQLVNQNHKLMTELENLSYDLHQARNKVLNILSDLHKESTYVLHLSEQSTFTLSQLELQCCFVLDAMTI